MPASMDPRLLIAYTGAINSSRYFNSIGYFNDWIGPRTEKTIVRKPAALPPFYWTEGGVHTLEGPAKKNRDALRAALHANGYRVNPKEWWHFSRLYGWRWPPARVPDQG